MVLLTFQPQQRVHTDNATAKAHVNQQGGIRSHSLKEVFLPVLLGTDPLSNLTSPVSPRDLQPKSRLAQPQRHESWQVDSKPHIIRLYKTEPFEYSLLVQVHGVISLSFILCFLFFAEMSLI